MLAITQNPLILSYKEADFFGKVIFFLLLIISISSWTVLQQKIIVQKKFSKSGKNLKEFLIKNRHSPLSLDTRPETSPFADLYFTIKRGTLELLDKNHQQSSDPHPKLSKDDMTSLENLLGMVMPKYQALLHKNNFIPITTISLAPFLGLLGTVWGILTAFSSMGDLSTSTNANATIMAGLSTALGTTIAGLFVAIPALIAYNYLQSQTSLLFLEIEQIAHLLLNTIELKYRENSL